MPHSETKKRAGNGGTVSKIDISLPPVLDLKEAISSARKTFKRDLKTSASSTPASLSPKQSEPKSASAPASPVKRLDSSVNLASKPPSTPDSVTSELKRQRRSLPTAVSKSTQNLSLPVLKTAAKNVDKKSPENVASSNKSDKIVLTRGRPPSARIIERILLQNNDDATDKNSDVIASDKTAPKVETKASKSVGAADDGKPSTSKKVELKPTQSDPVNVVKSSRKRGRPTSPKIEESGEQMSTNDADNEMPVPRKRGRPSTPKIADEKPSSTVATKKSPVKESENGLKPASTVQQNTPKSVEKIENKVSPKTGVLNDGKESVEREAKDSGDDNKDFGSKLVTETSNVEKSIDKPTTQEQTPKNSSNFDDDSKRRLSNNVSMNEVIKLHQDEGIIHLLHALPASRRKPSQMMAVTSRRLSSNEPRTVSQSSGATSQPAQNSAHMTQQQQQRQNQSQKFLNIGHFSAPPAKRILQDSTTNFLTSHLERTVVKPCVQEELMNTQALALIKQLPSKEYIRLWSSPARYSLVTSVTRKSTPMTIQTSLSVANGSTSSPSSSVGSDISSVSGTRQIAQARTVVWTVNSKNYKDILIRTYPTFAQVIISPVTTGLKNSINVNVCDELIDALKQLSNEAECRAVLVSGLGATFCQGVDLTILTYDSADRQRRSAENLASAIRRLITFLLSYPKILLAAVNGVARGLGVTILPFFDVVFASDKATFSADYARLGQIPECFASQSFASAGHLAMNEILLFGKTVTATEAVSLGFVSSVVWPDKFLEEIVPRVETLEAMSMVGLRAVKLNMKSALRRAVNQALMEEETKQLVANWTHPAFAKTVRTHLRTNRLEFQ